MPSPPPPELDREEIRKDISRMAFRHIRADRSLNIDQELAGDEIVSILDRLCKKYCIDAEKFWSQIDFDVYFFIEFNLFEFVCALVKYNLRGRPKGRELKPFMIDDIIRIMQKCRLDVS